MKEQWLRQQQVFISAKSLIKRCEIKGIRFAELTLHTGLGTFRPIEVEDLSKHKMDAEYYSIDEECCQIVNKAKETEHRICSIGTTTMRAMETSFTAQKFLKPSEGWTNIFIHPPYKFNVATVLVTNFHLPKTSLLIMACAFAGYDLIMEAYKKAIKDKYRFFQLWRCNADYLKEENYNKKKPVNASRLFYFNNIRW